MYVNIVFLGVSIPFAVWILHNFFMNDHVYDIYLVATRAFKKMILWCV